MMPRRHLDIEALRAFACIVDSGGFSAAAARLGRTQSAVSLQIKRLEEVLGQTLLRRVQGRVEGPTAEGTALLAYARQILRLNDEAYATVAQDTEVGSLRVGLPEELMESVFPAVMPVFRALYPRLRLTLNADTSQALQQALAAGSLDLALYKHCGDSAPADGEVLWQEALVWMAGTAYRDSLTAPGEAGLPLALFGENCVFRLAVTTALARAGQAWSLNYTGHSVTGLSHAVRCGLGITAMPQSLLGPGMAEVTHLADQPLPSLPPARLLAAYAPGTPATAARRFATLVGEAMGKRNPV
ncbi:LysR substrate-binding domain-containing protein [uncultured Dechloromonas sp.]|uniref:LysR substrate-binding domain-containing protein n=1 Tax=uncultured Dechloromonas sp. TaxID=171719 RepID=UPI0025F4784A|nr:LysR substrate-binding domain-containing protein [uncultured Dechloromonas sp.]